MAWGYPQRNITEQYNNQFVEQVAAMEAKAKTIGMGGKLKYIFPSNGGLNPADTIKAKALGIDAQMAADIHVGGGGTRRAVPCYALPMSLAGCCWLLAGCCI